MVIAITAVPALVPALLASRPLGRAPFLVHPPLRAWPFARSSEREATGERESERDARMEAATRLYLGRVLDEQRVQVQPIGQYPRPDRAPPHAQRGVAHWVLAPCRDLGLFEVRVHGGVDPDDRPGYDGAIFELDGDLLPVQFLEEFDKLHGCFVCVLVLV